MKGHHPDYPPVHHELNRAIEITDFDTGTPITHRIELYRSIRIDCYKISIGVHADIFGSVSDQRAVRQGQASQMVAIVPQADLSDK